MTRFFVFLLALCIAAIGVIMVINEVERQGLVIIGISYTGSGKLLLFEIGGRKEACVITDEQIEALQNGAMLYASIDRPCEWEIR